jgi:hypothetical protein
MKETVVEDIKLPLHSQFLIDLILQRTGPFISLGGSAALKSWFEKGERNSLVNFLSEQRLTDKFLNLVLSEVRKDVSEIVRILPDDALDKVVSIGPGNGLLELFLLKRDRTQSILLVDIEYTDTHHHGYNTLGAGYASLLETKKFLMLNGISERTISLCNPRREPLPQFPFSFLLSTLSMGFHYPCDEYVEFIKRNVLPKGVLIFDKRVGVPNVGLEALKNDFDEASISSSGKSVRVLLTKS